MAPLTIEGNVIPHISLSGEKIKKNLHRSMINKASMYIYLFYLI